MKPWYLNPTKTCKVMNRLADRMFTRYSSPELVRGNLRHRPRNAMGESRIVLQGKRCYMLSEKHATALDKYDLIPATCVIGTLGTSLYAIFVVITTIYS